MRKERPRILDRDGPAHEMDESTNVPRPHTCPKRGATRSRNAVPCPVLDLAIGRGHVPSCGAQFESWTSGAASRTNADGLAKLRGERESVCERASYMPRRRYVGTALAAESVCRRTLAGRYLA